MSDTNEWFIVEQLRNENTKFIKIIPRYTEHKYDNHLTAYCVTNNDEVYQFVCFDGEHVDNDDNNSISEPTKLEELSYKQLIDIQYGLNFNVALTNYGAVYSWGNNDCGQLGHGSSIKDYVKPMIISSIIKSFVADIRCGTYFCLALTRNGEVFEWGKIGATKEYNFVPTRVIGLLFRTIISISCGCYHSLVLTENGEVFGWGYNSKGQLGIGNNVRNYFQPIKIDNLNGDTIIKINCGNFYSILLSESGDIYAFGRNDFGQCGDNTSVDKNIPIKIEISTKFVDITALSLNLYNNHLSVGLSENGFCYVWGQCAEQTFNKPTKTEFKNIDEVILKHSNNKMTCKSYYFKRFFEDMTPLERFKETFNKQEFKLNDIKFKIDGKYIYTQKSYLISVCEHFDTLFSNEWQESTNNEIEITQYSYSAYYAFLKYLYTNTVDIKSKDLLELYFMADSYFEENLKKKCIEIMKEVINVNNVINFYAFAVKNNFEDLERYMYDYMKYRLKAVIKSEAFNQFNDISIIKNLLVTEINNGIAIL